MCTHPIVDAPICWTGFSLQVHSSWPAFVGRSSTINGHGHLLSQESHNTLFINEFSASNPYLIYLLCASGCVDMERLDGDFRIGEYQADL